MLEYEKKIMLTVDEYLSILILKCRHLRMNTQTNYYFDDDDFSMNKKGITCRIREKGGKYKSTVKNHNTRHPNLSIEVDLAETTKFHPQIFNAFGLHNKGELVTQRIVMYKDSNCEMVLDRNLYLGYEDFELEVEYVEGAEEKAQALIDDIAEFLVAMQHLNEAYELSVRVDKGACKSQRFFERRKNY
ncbi:MAG: CYTH domain-containing protein [Clostridia bacterium]|nr:CYTH domain-containing protein [Clostridia bacterium]